MTDDSNVMSVRVLAIAKNIPWDSWESSDDLECARCGAIAKRHPDELDVFGCQRCGFVTASAGVFFRLIKTRKKCVFTCSPRVPFITKDWDSADYTLCVRCGGKAKKHPRDSGVLACPKCKIISAYPESFQQLVVS